MRYRSFNADPHPSNLIVSDGGTLNWVDFGAVGWLDERQWDLQFRLRDAIAHEQIHGAYLALLEAMEPLPYRNLRPFEQEIKRILSDYLIASRDPTRRSARRARARSCSRRWPRFVATACPMTSSTVQLYRTILVADIVMLGLYPTIDWRGHLRKFLRDLSADLVRRSALDPVTSPYTWYRLARAPMAATETMEWVMRRLPDIGRQTLRTLSAGERLIPYVLRLLRRLGGGDRRRPGAGSGRPPLLPRERVRPVPDAHRRQPLARGRYRGVRRAGARQPDPQHGGRRRRGD